MSVKLKCPGKAGKRKMDEEEDFSEEREVEEDIDQDEEEPQDEY